MTFLLNSIFSLSIGIAALVGGYRFQKIDTAYHPFVYWIWLSFLNEIFSILIVLSGYSNAPNANLFLYLQAILIIWQFYRWGLFRRMPLVYFTLISGCSLFWIWETFLYSSLHTFNSYFLIASSFQFILLSISMINKLLVSERNNLLKNACFLICFTMLITFTFSVLVETFWLYGLNKSSLFRIRIFAIFSYINLIANLIFALAVLWMPMKLRYILLF